MFFNKMSTKIAPELNTDEVLLSRSDSIQKLESQKLDIDKFAIRIETLLDERELIGEKADYKLVATQMYEVIQELENYSDNDIYSAILDFNNKFASIPVDIDIAPPTSNDSTLSLKSFLLNYWLGKNSCFNQNIIGAFLSVYCKMESQELDYQLFYHQSAHPFECYMDLICLQSSSNSKHTHFNLLISLCALFHDIVFSRNRIKDEKESAKELEHFLELVLNELNEKHKLII